MAKLILQNQAEPVSPDAGCTTLYVDSCDGKTKVKNSNGCINIFSCMANIAPCVGDGAPTSNPDYIGQTYINCNKTGGTRIANGLSQNDWVFSGGGICVSVALVGGGGGGAGYFGGGGGGGGVCELSVYKINSTSTCVIVGSGGSGGYQGVTCRVPTTGTYCCYEYVDCADGCDGGDSCFGSVVVHGGKGGESKRTMYSGSYGYHKCGKGGNSGNGYIGGQEVWYNCPYCSATTGGGGAGANQGGCNSSTSYGGRGGRGSTIPNISEYCSVCNVICMNYAGGGGGGGYSTNCSGCAPGGCGGGGCGENYMWRKGGDATYYGGGGGGGAGSCCSSYSYCKWGGDGYSGVVVVSYPTGYITASGGNLICNLYGITKHIFTTNGKFCILG